MEDLLYLVSDWTLGDWLLLVLWLCVFWGVVRFFLRPRFPMTFTTRARWICDGDTFWVKHWFYRRFKVRLLGMDAPESEQRWGKESQRYLQKLIGGRTVTIHAVTRDMYGRWVARVEVGGKDVSLAMIEAGMAWPYYQYFRNLDAKDREIYAAAGREAQRQRKGLWSDKQPKAPWTWREEHRTWWSRFCYWLRKVWRGLFG